MVFVKKEGIILEPTGLEFENQGVLNPACIQQGNTVHMFYRAVRQGNYSSIGYCKLNGPMKVVERANKPVLFPEYEYEKHGTEDPRISFIEGMYYMTYVAYDGKNAIGAYATSKDLKTFKKNGIITPQISYDLAEDYFRKSITKLKEKYFFFESYYKDVMGKDVLLWEKDLALFPKKINGNFALIHRILPDIQVAYFNDFNEVNNDYWKKYLKKLSNYVILESRFGYESRNIGGGCPPIETDKGWLLIYHAVEDTNRGKVYRAAAALLDLKNPCKVLSHLPEPLFSPEKEWELKGDVNNVVFPTGTALFGNTLYIYYGAADKRIAVASLDINELLDELLNRRGSYNIITDIGFTAGEIFRFCKDRARTFTELNEYIHKKKEIILLATGWLARENKIELLDLKKEIKIKTKN
ncbi:winged helix-turn-helix domain-containing protein [Candidatus Woesearchaeota archaeon]|nr:winged helix-turn-helix domain-containing protein [Candidatus Woesearchaeota archaeon]